MRSRLLALAAAVSLLAAAPAAMAASLAPAHAAAPSASRPCGTLASPHRYTHVVWVWMENHSYNAIIGSPQARYINSLAAQCGLATNYHAIPCSAPRSSCCTCRGSAGPPPSRP